MTVIELSGKSEKSVIRELVSTGVSQEGIRILTEKSCIRPVKIYRLPVAESGIIKQEMLSLGADAALSAKTANSSAEYTDVILFGTVRQYRKLTEKLRFQPFSRLKKLAEDIHRVIFGRPQFFMAKDRRFSLDRCYIMGIVNVTPDSFFTGSRKENIKEILDTSISMQEQGADFIDIGAESSRPGAKRLTPSEELERLKKVVPLLRKNISAVLSIDTCKSEVAQFCIDEGFEIVNDISAMCYDLKMAETVSASGSSAVLMHMQGEPDDMQHDPFYFDPVREVYEKLEKLLKKAVDSGIRKENLILDPGIGFGKRVTDNYSLLFSLDSLHGLGCPVLLGLSRKSMIGKVLSNQPEERLNGTVVLNTAGVLNGADIIRVHDVKEASEMLKLLDFLKKSID